MERNINQENNHVKKKFIKPLFNTSLYADLGYSLDDLSYHSSFEECVSSSSFPEYSQRKDQIRFSLNKCPELLKFTIWYLKSKHKNLQAGQAAVQRYLTQAGVIILEKIPGLKVVNTRRRDIYEHGDEKTRLESSKRSYDYGYRISLTSCRMTVYAFEWAGSKISEIASDLGLHQETVVIASLIAGMSTSKKWIPVNYRDLFLDETIRFAKWVDEI